MELNIEGRNNALRQRIERLLSGNMKTDDLMKLFLFARDHCDGRQTVRDIGDFVAHHSERNKGLVVSVVQDFCAIMDVKLGPWSKTLDTGHLPSNYEDFLTATAKRLSSKIIKEKTNHTRAEVQKILDQLKTRLDENSDGTKYFRGPLSKREQLILNCLGNYLVVEPAFDADKIFEGFRDTLKSNGLLKTSELNTFAGLRNAILLFAVTTMHGSLVNLKSGEKSQLFIETVEEGKNGFRSIQILCNKKIALDKNKVLFVAGPIFDTKLDAGLHCSFRLNDRPDFCEGIELDANCKISRIR